MTCFGLPEYGSRKHAELVSGRLVQSGTHFLSRCQNHSSKSSMPCRLDIDCVKNTLFTLCQGWPWVYLMGLTVLLTSSSALGAVTPRGQRSGVTWFSCGERLTQPAASGQQERLAIPANERRLHTWLLQVYGFTPRGSGSIVASSQLG